MTSPHPPPGARGALPPSPFPPNYDTRAPGIVALGSIMFFCTTVAVVLRFWSRIIASKLEFWWDDWVLTGTLVRLSLSRRSCLFVCVGLTTYDCLIRSSAMLSSRRIYTRRRWGWGSTYGWSPSRT